MTTFSELGLAEDIQRAVEAEGYTTPTPIQAQAIPAILDRRDLVGIAQTGTGKTAAFVLPILDRLARNRQRPAPKTCHALILAPTRELASQIGECIRAYGRFSRPTSAVVVGGVGMGPQVRNLSRGVDILVATPGRLLDHVQQNTLSLLGTSVVVLDEADQMMDLGFMPAVRRVMSMLSPKRQTILLSATMPPQIRALADDFLHDVVQVEVAPQSKPVDRIEQKVVLVEGAAKRAALVDILIQPEVGQTIVFTRTKRGADRVAEHLEGAGLAAAAIHGNKSQNQRERALGAFKGGHIKVLVATDIAARGIDVDGVSHVINYELPNVPEAYVHRIGRTARAGASGAAISLCDSSERSLLRDIEKLIGRTLVSKADLAANPPLPGAPKKPIQGQRGGGNPAANQNNRRSEGGPVKPFSAKRPGKPGGNAQGRGGRNGGGQSRPQAQARG